MPKMITRSSFVKSLFLKHGPDITFETAAKAWKGSPFSKGHPGLKRSSFHSLVCQERLRLRKSANNTAPPEPIAPSPTLSLPFLVEIEGDIEVLTRKFSELDKTIDSREIISVLQNARRKVGKMILEECNV